MWHASIAFHGRHLDRLERRRRAYRALHGVGDAILGEWVEETPRSIHLRRRLSFNEVMHSGCVLRDIRGTDEAAVLLEPLRRWLPAGWTE